MAPGQHERLLNRVLRSVWISQDQSGGAMQPGERCPHQFGEGFVVARLRSFDELSLHVATTAARLSAPRSQDESHPQAPAVPPNFVAVTGNRPAL
jgi:hypothetical protein